MHLEDADALGKLRFRGQRFVPANVRAFIDTALQHREAPH